MGTELILEKLFREKDKSKKGRAIAFNGVELECPYCYSKYGVVRQTAILFDAPVLQISCRCKKIWYINSDNGLTGMNANQCRKEI